MSDLFWTVSDLHFGHRLVAELRGFTDTDEHDRVVLDHLREVPDGSVLLCLGTSRCVRTPTRSTSSASSRRRRT